MSTSRFFAGALVGLVVGLLVAPEKGEDMRDEIADTANKWKHKLNKLAGRASTEVSDLKSMLGSEIEGLGDDVRSRILNIIDESTETAKNIKRNVTSEFR